MKTMKRNGFEVNTNKTFLKLRLRDWSMGGCVCFEDIIMTHYSTPEQLFTEVFDTYDIGITPSDIWVGFDENGNSVMQIDFRENMHYYYRNYSGLEMCNEVTYFFDRTKRVLTNTKYFRHEDEITDEEALAILSGEAINTYTNPPDHDEAEEEPI
jgi:hypothetical protein